MIDRKLTIQEIFISRYQPTVPTTATQNIVKSSALNTLASNSSLSNEANLTPNESFNNLIGFTILIGVLGLVVYFVHKSNSQAKRIEIIEKEKFQSQAQNDL